MQEQDQEKMEFGGRKNFTFLGSVPEGPWINWKKTD